jgi:hypothetical protein
MSEEKDELEKMKYLQLLLESYNRYLKRNLKVGINNIDKIYSIIMAKDVVERNQIISLLCNTLEGDRLNLAKFLLTIHKIPDSEFYIKESYLQQLKPMGIALATAIPIIISFLGLLHL